VSSTKPIVTRGLFLKKRGPESRPPRVMRASIPAYFLLDLLMMVFLLSVGLVSNAGAFLQWSQGDPPPVFCALSQTVSFLGLVTLLQNPSLFQTFFFPLFSFISFILKTDRTVCNRPYFRGNLDPLNIEGFLFLVFSFSSELHVLIFLAPHLG